MTPEDFLAALDRHRIAARVESRKIGHFVKRYNFSLGEYDAYVVTTWDNDDLYEGGVVMRDRTVVAYQHYSGYLFRQVSPLPWCDRAMVELALLLSE